NSQKSAFTKEEWDTINNKWNVKKNWTPLDKQIKSTLKDIEKMAKNNIKEAYKECLYYQRKYAMTEEEIFFEVYASMYVFTCHCIQIFGVEGQINQVKLVDDGLYISRGLGSLFLPTCGRDMYKTRILLERLMSMKKMAISNR
ncbi:uncharacterized protein BX663DRAFT_411176, partial [Cokeromyces recurvatus]|uniref:uncharacterized protein n=1 Tax=Cokeromyces recurvatus TaxID=90255 RepID=UPI00221F2570